MVFGYLRVSLLCLCVVMGGCSTFWGDEGLFRNREKDYQYAGTIKRIDLPDGMRSAPLEPLLVVPAVDVTDEFGDPLSLIAYEVPRPKPIDGEKGDVGVKIQKLGDERWIFLNASTAQVWPQTRSFLSEYEIDVVRSIPEEGLIETDWIMFKNDNETKSRYRITIEKGIHAETSEVHVTHFQLPVAEKPPADFTWPEQSSSPERESWMMDDLAASLAASVDNSAASLMGQNVGNEEKAQFGSEGSEPALKLRLPFVRGWASLLHSSNQGGFVRWDENSDQQVMYVGVDYEAIREDDESILEWLAFWRDDGEAHEESKYSMAEVLAHLENSPEVVKRFDKMPGVAYGEPLKDTQGYLLVVSREGKYLSVVIRDYRGRKVPEAQAKKMLRIIRRNLI